MFQSLFFWMLLSKPVPVFPAFFGKWRFQSLFFWMLLSKLPDTPIVILEVGSSFNPYFSGCFSLSAYLSAVYASIIVVSILIFLDASL